MQKTLTNDDQINGNSEQHAVVPEVITRRNSRTWLLVLHLLCIGLFSAFLVWGLQGKTPINGDDVRVLRKVELNSIANKYDYLRWTRSRYHVLAVLESNYQAAGQNIDRANLIWLATYVVSSFAAYAYLRKVFCPGVALIGAIFYLCYSSKFEPLTWWSAGAYTTVWLSFFCLLTVLESKAKYAARAVGISLIVLISLYVYEVLVVLTPVFSAILLLRRKREVLSLRPRDWLLGMLPVIVVLVHVITLATATTPLYLNNRELNRLPIANRVVSGFTSAIDSTIGPKHAQAVKAAVHAFDGHYKQDFPFLQILLFFSVGVTAVVWLLSLRWSSEFVASPTTLLEHASIGLVALFLSASIGFVSNQYVTPSRLTGVPSIGLMISICAILEWIFCAARRFSGRLRFTLIGLVSALSVVAMLYSAREVKAFTSMLRQAGEVHDFDLRIANKIKAIHPLVSKGEEIFVRTPRAQSEVVGRWTNFWSGFNSGRADETLWYLYDVDPGNIRFTCSPYLDGGESARMQQVVEGWNSRGTINVFPFYVNENGDVFAIEKLKLTNPAGQVLKSLDFSSRFSNLPSSSKVTQAVAINSLPNELH